MLVPVSTKRGWETGQEAVTVVCAWVMRGAETYMIHPISSSSDLSDQDGQKCYSMNTFLCAALRFKPMAPGGNLRELRDTVNDMS